MISKANDGNNVPQFEQPQYLPVFYFAHELEYDGDQFDQKSDPYINYVAVDMNYELNIKTVWEFKNPRIDSIVS